MQEILCAMLEMPSRPFTRRQALPNRRFPDALARTGNVRLSAAGAPPT